MLPPSPLCRIFMHLIPALWLCCLSLMPASSVCAGTFATTLPKVVDPRYEIEILVPGSYFHGIHGLTFDAQDNLYVGSVLGQAIYRVDTRTGAVNEHIGPPLGMADDLEFGPNGRLYWTSYLLGKVHCMGADGTIIELAEGLPGINSLAFDQTGRLFATQVFLGDALYEIDLSGQKNTRKIAEKLGGLNAFDFGRDNRLYGPLWNKNAVARVDVETGDVEVIAKGFHTPAAVNFDSKGNLYVVDTALGEVVRVDVGTGQKRIIAKMAPAIDNLAFDSKDRLFITNSSDNAVYQIDTQSGTARAIVEGRLSCAGGIAVATDGRTETLYLADIFNYRKVDGQTGKVSTIKRTHAKGSHIENPTSVSVHGNSVLLTSWFRGSIQEMDRQTDQSKRILHKFKQPSHAVMTDDKSMLVAEIGTGSLLHVSGEKSVQRKVVAKGLDVPTCLALSDDDRLYVTEAGAGIVGRIDLASGEKHVIASGLKMPEGIAVDPNDKIVVVETGRQRLVEIDPASGVIKTLVTHLAVGYPTMPGTPLPGIVTGVTVSTIGIIYVTGDFENVVYKIIPRAGPSGK